MRCPEIPVQWLLFKRAEGQTAHVRLSRTFPRGVDNGPDMADNRRKIMDSTQCQEAEMTLTETKAVLSVPGASQSSASPLSWRRL